MGCEVEVWYVGEGTGRRQVGEPKLQPPGRRVTISLFPQFCDIGKEQTQILVYHQSSSQDRELAGKKKACKVADAKTMITMQNPEMQLLRLINILNME
jgi:hypothetical protein